MADESRGCHGLEPQCMALAVLEVVDVFEEDVGWRCREFGDYLASKMEQGARARILRVALLAH